MILTVTLNSALDRVMFIDEFQPGTTMRPHKMIESVGGKGFDTSVALQTLGAQNLALGFVAGLTGKQLVNLLNNYGIRHNLIWVDGETRIAHVIIETRHHRHSHLIAAGLSVSATAYKTLLAHYQTHLNEAAWVVAGGSLAGGVPSEAYAQLSQLARVAGVPVLIDSFGEPLRRALADPPAIVKMNRPEFAHTFNQPSGPFDALVAQAQAIGRQYRLPALVITCGADGLLACTPEATYLAATPPQKAVNAAGAGDAVSAALAWRLSEGDGWPDALKWAVATGAATVLTQGTADCRWEDIERLANQANIKHLES